MDKSIVLIGMMGAGKSSLGRRLAQRLGLPFIDADHALEKELGMSIAQMFARHGESWFREQEKELLKRLLDGNVQVIATGGGSVCDAATRALFREKAQAVWLQADVASLYNRVARDKNRPLLQQADPYHTLAGLLAARQPFYAEALIHIKTDGRPFEQTLDELVARLQEHA